MAGVVPRRATSGRKLWTVHDGPRSSLKPLRRQMAEDGCPESQVVLAKQLLDEHCEIDTDTRENEILGVYWLIKASEQGNIEATNLLKTCIKTGKGITELNYLDVKSCISMTQHEKLARKAAKEMFASLSNGGEYITSNLLQKKILAIERDGLVSEKDPHCMDQNNSELVYDESESDSDVDWSQKPDISNEKLNEDHLVSAAVDYSHGHLPLVSRTLCLHNPDLKALDHIPLVQRPILHPIIALKILYYKLIQLLGHQLSLLFPLAKSEMQLVGLLLLYSLVSSDNILYFLPMAAYYISLIVMVIVTFQMLQVTREFHDFRLWSGLFLCYSGGDLDPEEAEFHYICNNLKPYAMFFGSLFVNLLLYPLIVDRWIPQSELVILSFCLTLATLLGFMQTRRGKTILDFSLLLSFGINVLAKYPYKTDTVVAQGWRFLDLKIPTFATYVIGNGIEFCINFRLLLYLFIPILLVRLAARRHWKGTYETLLPHCVTLSWLQICIVSSEGATMFGLLRGSLALVGIVLFLPLVGLTSVILPAFALTKWIITSNLFVSICAFAVLCTFSGALFWAFAQTRFKKITALLQVLLTYFAAFLLLKSVNFHEETYYERGELPEFLSWQVYQRFCHLPVWQEENIAVAQIKCAQLHDSHVNWDGYITDIKIKSISNKFEATINKLPKSLREYLFCFYGEEVVSDCSQFPQAVREECNSFYNAIKSVNRCSLQKYNSYTFEITTKMHSGIWEKSPEVLLIVNDYTFNNFTLSLKPNDHIWFKGTLLNNEIIGTDGVLGGSKTNINLNEIGCLACSNSKLTSIKKNTQPLFDINNCVNAFISGLKFLLNVILSPVVIFK